ncbi:MAG: hypothetical protein ABEK04_00115, partial [Candidatus Nanohalobium sp.]
MAENIGQIFKDIREGDYRSEKVADRLLESADEASHEGTLSVFISATSYLADRDKGAVDNPEVYRKLNECLQGLSIGDSSLVGYPEDRYDAFDALEKLPESANPNENPIHVQNMITAPKVHELNQSPSDEQLNFYAKHSLVEIFEGIGGNEWEEREQERRREEFRNKFE